MNRETIEPLDWSDAEYGDDRQQIKFLRAEPGQGKAKLGNGLLIVSSVVLTAIAVAAMVVSFKAQYAFVMAEKHDHLAALLEALILDGGAVVVAMVGLALSLKGMSALVCRALNLAFIGASVTMNVFSAQGDFSSIAVWAMAPVVYALTSDLLISNVRRLMVEETEDSPIRKARGLALWTLRLTLDPIGTLKGFRSWVLTLPTAPGGYERVIAQPETVIEEPVSVSVERAEEIVIDERVSVSEEARSAIEEPVSVPDERERPALTVVAQSNDRIDEVIALIREDMSVTGKTIAEKFDVSEATGRRWKTAAKKAIGEEAA